MTRLAAKNCSYLLAAYLGIENTCSDRADVYRWCRGQLEHFTHRDLSDHTYADLMRLCDDLIAQSERLAA